MFYQSHLLSQFSLQIRLFRKSHYVHLLIWLLPLLLFTSGQTSLMAHDEALYATRARLMFDSGNWIAPWENAHHKTPGFYWLIAVFYQLFGVSDITARIPAMIAAIFSTLVIYQIAKILLGKKLAYLSTAILSVEFLWLQYSRLVAPDILMILLVYLSILYLLKSELYPKLRLINGFISGLCLALAFLIRSFMIFLPIGALLPYLIGENRRHLHLKNPMLYLGFVVGFIPTLVWLWFSWQYYGGDSFTHLWNFVLQLGSREQHGNNILFYFWNIPLKSFPWFFFSLLGLAIVIFKPIPRYQLLLVGFPVVFFAEISLFLTRFSHYSLCLYPFIAMFAAVGLDWLGKIDQPGQSSKFKVHLIANISYIFGTMGAIFIIAGVVVLLIGIVDIKKYAILAVISGVGCVIVPLIWILISQINQKFISNRYWVGSWLIASWLSLSTAGTLGLLGDFNPEVRMFFQQKSIAAIIQNHPVAFVQLDDKYSVLINFYTPFHDQKVQSISQLLPGTYAWIYTPKAGHLPQSYRLIGSVKNYQLVQVLSVKNQTL